jgi:hypothetical protein
MSRQLQLLVRTGTWYCRSADENRPIRAAIFEQEKPLPITYRYIQLYRQSSKISAWFLHGKLCSCTKLYYLITFESDWYVSSVPAEVLLYGLYNLLEPNSSVAETVFILDPDPKMFLSGSGILHKKRNER